jgi:hypothetical protein
MPDSFYEMLEGAMTYKPKTRSTAGQLLRGEFPQFHIHHDENQTMPSDDEDGAERQTDDLLPRRSIAKTKSVLLEGSVGRHSTFLGYQHFERSLTTLLATMLPTDLCKTLVVTLRNYNQSHAEQLSDSKEGKEEAKRTDANKLQVIPVKDLVVVIQEMNTPLCNEV